MDCSGEIAKRILDERRSLGALQFHESWGEPRSFNDSFFTLMRKYFVYVCFSGVKVNLMVFISLID